MTDIYSFAFSGDHSTSAYLGATHTRRQVRVVRFAGANELGSLCLTEGKLLSSNGAAEQLVVPVVNPIRLA